MDFFLPDKKEAGKLRDRHLITYCVDIYLGLTRVIDIQETTTLYAFNITLLLVIAKGRLNRDVKSDFS